MWIVAAAVALEIAPKVSPIVLTQAKRTWISPRLCVVLCYHYPRAILDLSERAPYICQPCHAVPVPFTHYRSQHMSVVSPLAAPYYSTLSCISSLLLRSLRSCYNVLYCILTMDYNTINLSYYLFFLHTVRTRPSPMEPQSERNCLGGDGLLGNMGESQ